MNRHGLLRTSLWFLVLPLVACGGGSGDGSVPVGGDGNGNGLPVLPNLPIGGGESPAPSQPGTEAPAATTTRFQIEGVDVGQLLSTAALEADRDEDGLPDLIDPYPDIPAVRDDPAQPLLIQRAGLQLDGGWVDGVAHASQSLVIELLGATPGEPLYVVLGRREGLHVMPVALEGGLITLPANVLSVPLAGLSVMTANWRSEAVPLRWVAADAPWVTGVGDAEQGRLLQLEGVNLAAAEVLLNDQPLHVVDARTDSLSVALPPDAASGTLAILQGEAEPQRLPLMVWRTVRVELAPEIAEAVTQLEWFDNDEPRLVPANAAFTRRMIAAAEPSLVSFRPDLERPALPLAVLIDPQATRLHLSAEQMLVGMAYRIRKAAEPEVSDDAAAVKVAILSQLASPQGQALLADFRASLLDYDYHLLRAHQDRLTALLAGQLPTQAAAKFFYQGLSDRTVYDQNIRFRNYNSGGSFTSANLPQVAKKEISNFRITLADPSLSIFERCNSLPVPARPATAWPSDLCVENDNVVPASVGVFVGDGRARRYLRSHLNHRQFSNDVLNLFNPDILGGNTLGIFRVAQHQYLETRDESPQPLCRLMPCSVEILTGAFGLADNTPLEGKQAVANLLRDRMMLDVFVIPYLASVLGIDANAGTQVRQCLANLGNEALTAVTLAPDFITKFRDTRGANNQVDPAKFEVFVDQVLQELFLKLFQVVQTSGLSCAQAVLVGTARQRLASALEELAQRSAVGRIVSVIDTTIALIELAITPRRIVFDVKPVLLQSTNLNRRTVAPSQGENLQIEGIGIAQNDDGAGRRYFPALVVTGRALNGSATQTASFNFTADHFSETGTFGVVRLTVPAANLRTLLEANFLPGDLQISLRYFHRPYPGFPNQQVEIPLGTVNYRGQPVASRLNVAAALSGKTVRILGYRLDTLNLSASQPAEVVFTPGGLTDERTVRTNAVRVGVDRQAKADERGYLEVAVPNFQRQGNRAAQNYTVQVDLGQDIPSGQVLGEPSRLRSVGSIQVYDGQPGRVTVADSGACPTDDQALVELLRADGQRASFPEAVDIPSSFTVGPQNGYRDTLAWLDELTTPLNRVERIRLTCTNAGDDCGSASEGASVCTFSVRIESPDGTDILYQDTLAEGEQLVFTVR